MESSGPPFSGSAQDYLDWFNLEAEPTKVGGIFFLYIRFLLNYWYLFFVIHHCKIRFENLCG